LQSQRKGAAVAPHSDPAPAGQRLGDFEIVRELGRGGMGIVYEARQISLNRRVALKILSGGLGLNTTAVQRFQREAEAAARLHHTNIVPVYATGEVESTHFYAMELIDGPSLDYVVRQLSPARGAAPLADKGAATGPYLEEATTSSGSASKLTSSSLSSDGHYFDTVARLIAAVADALDYAHKQGVIHRDIKPSNLLLSADGRLSINDFGLARILEQPGMTIAGELVGTPMYMSPEQVAAGRTPLDHRTDIYSLGATLYELLTLQPPFRGVRREEILGQIIHKEPRPPRKVNRKVPVDLETICLKAMDKDPDRRYQTAGQMAEDLQRYVHRFVILARRAGPVAKAAKWLKRRPGLAAALAAILVCMTVAGWLGYHAYQVEQQRQAERAQHEQDLLAEKRRGALDKALLAARQEDYETAREAIHEAEELGCSPGQVQMLRGQVALVQGENKEAIDHLARATALLPESVTAWSMLAVAYFNDGRHTDYHRALAEATRLTPVTAEDFLFRGYAESGLDSERGLKTLEEAVRRRPSALARLVRTEVLRMNILDEPDPQKAWLAMEDVRVIKRQLSDNAMALSVSILIHRMAYHVFSEFQDPVHRQMALDEGRKDARALEGFPDSPRAVVARWVFLQAAGEAQAAWADLARVADRTNFPLAVYYCGQGYYLGGEFASAAQVLERQKGNLMADFVRVLALAELPDGPERANRLCEEVLARDLSDWDLFNAQLILRFLGRRQQALEVSLKFLEQPARFPPVRQDSFRRALEYCAGKRSADDLIRAVHGNRSDLCNAHLCIALTALEDGNRQEALKHFELCIKTNFFEILPYDVSRLLLQRMQKDSRWPRWVPHKK
jgi:tetratricopeptide (TPR) repeat protein